MSCPSGRTRCLNVEEDSLVLEEENQMRRLFLIAALLLAGASARADVTLWPFNFNSSQFGDTLLESDGGAHSSGNWLNVVSADPGNPAYLTGPNFDTGITNIGLSGPLAYTIGYATPIVNGAGDDLGVVVARHSTDSFLMAVSQDGVSFTPDVLISSGSAVDTFIRLVYLNAGNRPSVATLWVHPVDLGATFGLSDGASIAAVRITGTTELDLIRVAGFADAAVVPAPGALVLVGIGVTVLRGLRRRRVV
jgi:hypothetical protein